MWKWHAIAGSVAVLVIIVIGFVVADASGSSWQGLRLGVWIHALLLVGAVVATVATLRARKRYRRLRHHFAVNLLGMWLIIGGLLLLYLDLVASLARLLPVIGAIIVFVNIQFVKKESRQGGGPGKPGAPTQRGFR